MKYNVIMWDQDTHRWHWWWRDREINEAHSLKKIGETNYNTVATWLVVETATDFSLLPPPNSK